jgi:hypothetical protein
VILAYTSVAAVAAALGPTSGYTGDPVAATVVDAANAWVTRKRAQAGYTDETAAELTAELPDVCHGATLYAQALWRERASVDSFASFDDLASFVPTGTMGQIKRLCGIGRAAVDAVPAAELAAFARRRRRRVVRSW